MGERIQNSRPESSPGFEIGDAGDAQTELPDFHRAAITKLDDWRRGQDDVPTRSEAIRRLIKIGLERQVGEGS
jgi:hypothetical protein